MSEHKATVVWRRTGDSFAYKDYTRAHEWRIGSSLQIPASSAPEFLGDPERIDPERALVAALSSCHMLFVLALCSRRGVTVDSYEDEAVGILEKGPDGKQWVTRVTLRPRVILANPDALTPQQLADIHHEAHDKCFIANSVRTAVAVEPV